MIPTESFNQRKQRLVDAAMAVGGPSFAYRVGGKLRFDPVYKLLYERWVTPDHLQPHTYDLGGGMGLFPLLLPGMGRFTVVDHDERALAQGQKLSLFLEMTDRLTFLQGDLSQFD